MNSISITPVHIESDVCPGDDIAQMILDNCDSLQDNDVIVVSQKIVSKQENRLVDLSSVTPSLLANGIASSYGKDPRIVELILSESIRIVRMQNKVIIVKTHRGFVCANAGIDESNVKLGFATLLPKHPDQSAKRILDALTQKTGKKLAVIISDTFGRPFRMGQTDIAIGVAGIKPISDYAGKPDTFGRELRVTAIATADEICSSAELVMGKEKKCPAAIIRNLSFESSPSEISELLRPDEQDLFK